MKEPIPGVITADILEVRFAYAGKIAAVRKKTGEAVNKGEKIASLDRTPLQIDLDKQLADYERSRSDFELFAIKYRDQQDDITKFNRQSQQATLNSAVKDIESAKYKLDQADLISPVNGTIQEIALLPGLFITPASNAVAVIHRESMHFAMTVGQDDVAAFIAPLTVQCRFMGLGKEFTGMTVPAQWGKNGQFIIRTYFSDQAGLLPGMIGEARIVV